MERWKIKRKQLIFLSMLCLGKKYKKIWKGKKLSIPSIAWYDKKNESMRNVFPCKLRSKIKILKKIMDNFINIHSWLTTLSFFILLIPIWNFFFLWMGIKKQNLSSFFSLFFFSINTPKFYFLSSFPASSIHTFAFSLYQVHPKSQNIYTNFFF